MYGSSHILEGLKRCKREHLLQESMAYCRDWKIDGQIETVKRDKEQVYLFRRMVELYFVHKYPRKRKPNIKDLNKRVDNVIGTCFTDVCFYKVCCMDGNTGFRHVFLGSVGKFHWFCWIWVIFVYAIFCK